MARSILSGNLTQFDFGKLPHHPEKMNTPNASNYPASRNPEDINQVSVEARQLSHIYPSIDQETFDLGFCK
jgi:hypothetical protein